MSLVVENEMPRITEETVPYEEEVVEEYVVQEDNQEAREARKESEESQGSQFWTYTRIAIGAIGAIMLIVIIAVLATRFGNKSSTMGEGSAEGDTMLEGSEAGISANTFGYRLTENRWGSYKGHHLRLQGLGVSKTFFNFLGDKMRQRTINTSDEYPVLKSFFSYVKKLSPYVGAKPVGKVNPDAFQEAIRSSFKNDSSKDSQRTYASLMKTPSKSAENHMGRYGLDGIIVQAMLKESKRLGWTDMSSALKAINTRVYGRKVNADDKGLSFHTERRRRGMNKIDPRAKIIEITTFNKAYFVSANKDDSSEENCKAYTLDDLADTMVINEDVFHKSKLPFTKDARTYKLASLVFHKQSGSIGHCMVLARTKGTSRNASNAWVGLNHETARPFFMSDAEAKKHMESEKWGIYSFLLEAVEA